jgi:fructokinase
MLEIVCFGEVLYDVFPSYKKIGGAPLNVAIRLASLGANVHIISKIGNDELGRELQTFVAKNKVNNSSIQVDETLATGQVLVKLDNEGSASYTINYPAAWDRIALGEAEKELVEKSNALVFGSLVCRDAVSYNTLLNLLPFAKNKIFDVNLRAPFYNKEILIHLMNQADFIKFNDDELFEIAEMLGSPYHSLEQNIHFIAKETSTSQICVTKGSHGAVLFYNENLYYNSGFKIKVVDTVGSGDSFLAALLVQLLQNNSPQKAIDFACAVGAIVAQYEGANPEINIETVHKFCNPV